MAQAGHLGHHIHFLAAHGGTHGQVQEDFAVQINLCVIISHKSFIVVARLRLKIPIALHWSGQTYANDAH